MLLLATFRFAPSVGNVVFYRPNSSLLDGCGIGFDPWIIAARRRSGPLYLCCRARLAGQPVRALGASGYRHRVGASFGGGKVAAGRLATTFRRRALSERNKTFAMAMTVPAPWMQLLLPLHLALLLAEGTALSLLKLDGRYLRRIYLPVFGALLRERRRLLAGRAAVMRERRVAVADFFAAFDWMPYKLRMLMRHGLPKVI